MPRHLYRCPLRWADMDQLGHVNNVTYVDYLQEARVDMLRLHAPVSGGEELAEGVVVVRHEVDYVRPLVHRPEPVSIETWVTQVGAASFTLAYEIFDEDASGERTVYVRARSLLAPYVFTTESPRRITPTERETLAQLTDEHAGPRTRESRLARDPGDAWVHTYDCQVRFSDVDLYRHVNNVKYFEYVQEARIDMLGVLAGRTPEREPASGWHLVVGAIDVDYSRPILLRPEPYPIRSWVERVGTSSFTVASEIAAGPDGADVLARARAVLVTFDPATGRSVPLREEERAALSGRP